MIGFTTTSILYYLINYCSQIKDLRFELRLNQKPVGVLT